MIHQAPTKLRMCVYLGVYICVCAGIDVRGGITHQVKRAHGAVIQHGRAHVPHAALQRAHVQHGDDAKSAQT